MCMSECTSIPAALGWSIGIVTGWARGARDTGFDGVLRLGDVVLAEGRLCRLMVSATV
jgi:hypothetical protein